MGQWLSSFKDFPPRQKPASFSLDQVMQKLQSKTMEARTSRPRFWLGGLPAGADSNEEGFP